MNLDEAKALLNECIQDNQVDPDSGEETVFWKKGGTEVAVGYFEREGSMVIIYGKPFHHLEAEELRACGEVEEAKIETPLLSKSEAEGSKTMNIQATEYVREDGVSMCRRKDGTWVVQYVRESMFYGCPGRTFFYHPGKESWLTNKEMTSDDIELLGFTFGQAYSLLETVSPVK